MADNTQAAYAKWKKRRLRICRWLNHCKICNKDITDGQQYRDGGYGRRAHEDCVDGLIHPTFKTHEWCE